LVLTKISVRRAITVTFLNSGCLMGLSVHPYLGHFGGPSVLGPWGRGKRRTPRSTSFILLPLPTPFPKVPPAGPSSLPIFCLKLTTFAATKACRWEGLGLALRCPGCWGSRGFPGAQLPWADRSPDPPAGGSRVRRAKRRSINFSAQKSILLSGRRSMSALLGLAQPGLEDPADWRGSETDPSTEAQCGLWITSPPTGPRPGENTFAFCTQASSATLWPFLERGVSAPWSFGYL
jgi:hypothetical protein